MSEIDQQSTAPDGSQPDAGRGNNRRVLQGVVSSDKMAKTITVTIERQYKHPKYQKYIRANNKVHAHDEQGDAHLGDTVEIVECRPLSKIKRWRLLRVLTRAEITGGPL